MTTAEMTLFFKDDPSLSEAPGKPVYQCYKDTINAAQTQDGLMVLLCILIMPAHVIFSVYNATFNISSTAAGKLLSSVIIFMLCMEKTYVIITQTQVANFLWEENNVH